MNDPRLPASGFCGGERQRVESTHPLADARSREHRRGFALLIVVTLLAFIVVLLLGLAVYTRVETAVAGNTQRQAQARENALLALNVALGQLQKNAGPDTRVTATAQNFDGIDGTRHYTGVWNTDPAVTTTPGTPVTWLVSGNELTQPNPDPDAPVGSTVPAPLAITPALPGTGTVDLVGRNSTGSTTRTADYVIAPLTDIKTNGVPGMPPAASTTIGRYAWWVGDQGVKAPVALPDTSSAATFAPYDSAELRNRIRQQLSLGAGATEASSGAPLFEPRDNNNANLVADQKVAASNQLAFLRTTSNAQVGLARVRQNLHAWSPNNFAVLANTKSGGLRQDLSLDPTLLGGAFAAWANYPAYMEKFVPDPVDPNASAPSVPSTVSTTPTILPAYSADPIRRRYVMTPHLVDPNSGGSHQVGPVLTYFLITFNVHTVNQSVAANSPLEVRARWMISLWNPYTSALVPENLRVEISRLPNSVQMVNDAPAHLGNVIGSFSLQSAYDSPLRINLPWDSANAPAGTPIEDRQSWLPGRIYTWRSVEDTTKGSIPPPDGYASDFYSQTLDSSGDGVIRPLNLSVDGSDECHLEVSGSDQLMVTLYAVRPTGNVRLGAFTSPQFVDGFKTAPQEAFKNGYQFSYVFRLAESIDTPAALATWLTTDGRDVRRRTLPAEAFVVAENGNDPAQYGNSYKKIRNPDRLLDRATDSPSYNEDVPIFELPRAPLLSLGALQHFRMVGRRPLMIGNPWGVGERLNNVPLGEIFDRYFFSGLVDGVTPETAATGDLILPNPLLKPLRKPDRSKVTIDDVRALMNPPVMTDPDGNTIPGPPPSSFSAKYFLQSGAFNLNSTHAAAWAAVLRGVRFPAPRSFSYLDVSATSGTGEDAAQGSVQSTDAQFFRFSQSAQETYKAEAGMADNDPSATSPANTHLFRRGMRTLGEAQVAAFAAKIVELIGVKQAAADPAGGPFRSLDEFLSPSTLFAGVDASGNPLAPRSLLEAAIADANLNVDALGNPIEFSSQFLTQGDVMTALAPVLFPRSDTFVIRTYGEAVNPATSAVEGRAWAEAIVQRVPEFFADSANNPPETNATAFDTLIDPNDPASGTTQAQQLNKTYGRRFKVVSFRWLTRSDI